jgi:hypothetical protein
MIDDRRRIERPFAVIPVEQACTVSYRSLDATLELFRSVFMNDGSNIHRGIHRITAFELFGSFEHLLRKFVRDRFHAKDALDRRATLARILGGIQYRQLSRLFEVGVFHDNQRIVSAVRERDACNRRITLPSKP